MRHEAPADYSPPFYARPFMSHATRTLLLLTTIGCLACTEKPAKVAGSQTLGPEDIQMVSSDKSFALELIGDSVHVYMPGSRVSVPSTYIENLKYSDGRLRFDIRGLGVRIFEVGDGSEQGAALSQQEALLFMAGVTRNQAKQEQAGK
jgi:hypothetical protein